MVNFDALELGQILGSNIRKTEDYRDDFIENEEVLDILLANLESVIVSGGFVVRAFYFDEDSLVFNHPVRGDLNVFVWNGGYSGYEVFWV